MRREILPFRGIVLLLFTFLPACADLGTSVDAVSVSVGHGQLMITNGTDQAIYYAVFEQSILAVIDWAPICRSDNAIPPGHLRSLPAPAGSFQPSNTAVVYWWHMGDTIRGTELYMADRLRVMAVSIP
jgi:hypothetical protein